MGNVLVEHNTLSAIADSIREKKGSGEKMKPAMMPDAIRSIPSGGGGKEADESLPVRFFDYDGTLLYSYSLTALQQMEELPELPSHDGLVCEGWNWSLEDLKIFNREVNVAALYITDDGATRLYVHLDDDTLEPVVRLGQSQSAGVLLDWGDGSEPESVVSGGNMEVSFTHRYAQPGDYVIRFIPGEYTEITFLGYYSTGSGAFSGGKSTYQQNMKYFMAVRKIETGKQIRRLDSYCFSCFGRLESISISKTVQGVGNGIVAKCYSLLFLGIPKIGTAVSAYTCQECCSMRHVSVPNGVSAVYTYAFESCYSLQEIVIPDSAATIGSQAFRKCYSLTEIHIPAGVNKFEQYCLADNWILEAVRIPESVTEIPDSFVSGCWTLAELVIPSAVKTISRYAFENCSSMKRYYLMPETPPVLGSANAFNGIPDDCRIYVPKGCLEAYQTASYWSNYAGYMVEMEEGEVH